jgi:hypothetical protein
MHIKKCDELYIKLIDMLLSLSMSTNCLRNIAAGGNQTGVVRLTKDLRLFEILDFVLSQDFVIDERLVQSLGLERA